MKKRRKPMLEERIEALEALLGVDKVVYARQLQIIMQRNDGESTLEKVHKIKEEMDDAQ